MKQLTFALGTLLVLVTSAPAAAQQQPVPAEPKPVEPAQSIEQVIDSSGIVPAVEAIAATATPELERALGQLAQSLSVIAARIAADPELRASAVRAGAGMASVAEVVITEQSGALQEALRDLADRLEEISKKQ